MTFSALRTPAGVRRLRLPSTRVLTLLASFALILALYASAAFGATGTLVAGITSFPATTPVGNRVTLPLLVTFAQSGSPNKIDAISSGTTGMDFSISDPGTCGTLSSANPGDTCLLTVAFQPRYPGRRDGAVRILAADGTLLAQALVTGSAKGPLPVLKPGVITTVAGSHNWIYSGDELPATAASIFTPKAAVIDGAGNLYIADTGNNRIRRVDPTTPFNIHTIAGTGIPGYNGDGIAATAAQISSPAGLLLDGAGNLYFSDSLNSAVRRIDAVSGIITTVAGTPQQSGSHGDGGLATDAQLNLPESLAFDLQGNLLIADSGNNEIRKVNASDGKISTVAGKFASGYNGDNIPADQAFLADPTGVTVSADGSIYIADTANQRIRRFSVGGTITTVVGTGVAAYNSQEDGGPANRASVNSPANVVFDPAGNLYITDSGGNRVRMVNSATGNIETITGTDGEEYAGDDGPANLASHYGPYGLFYSPTGDIYLTDMFHMRVRKINASALPLSYPVMRVGKISQPKTAGLINDGNDTLNLSAPVFTESALDTATTTCFGATATGLGISAECKLGVEFAPTEVGNPVKGSLALPSNLASLTPTITLSGEVLSVNPTTVALSVLTPSTNPSIFGDNVTVQAQVTSDDRNRTGDVTFTLDGNPVCIAVPLASDGTANCTLSGLPLSSALHNNNKVVATYSGDAQNAAATSTPYIQIVQQRVVLTLTSSVNPSVVTKEVAFTIKVSAATGTPTGEVTFRNGGLPPYATVTLDANGNATFRKSDLPVGDHSIFVEYSGDATNAPLRSSVLMQTVRKGSTTTSVGTSNASANVGTPVTLSATVNSLDGLAPTGTVTFHTADGPLGTAPVQQADGSATLALPNLPAGNYSIVATYNGDTNDSVSDSTPLTQTSNKLATITVLNTDAATLTAGSALHLTAQTTLAPGSVAFGTISGTVAFLDNGNPLGTANIAADGTATFTAPDLTVGSHALVATYSGDLNYAVSSGTHTQTVVQTASAITVTSAATTVLAGKEARFAATVSSNTGVPTGSVVFKEGDAVVGTAPLARGIANLATTTLPAGSHTLVATYTGDANYLPVSSDPIALNVVLAQTSLALTGPGSAVTVTTAANFSAAFSTEGVTPGGTLTLNDGGAVVATQNVSGTGTLSFSVSDLAVGQHTLTVHYSGDQNNASVTSSPVSLEIRKADSSTAVATSLTPSVLGKDVTFTAKVSSGIANLTGTVSLLENGQVLGSAPLNNGTAAIVLSTLAFGDHTLVASYSGDAQHNGSASTPLQQSIIQQASVVFVTSLNPAVSGQTVILTATVPGVAGQVPTGNIVFSDGATVLGTVRLNGAGQASLQTSTLSVATHSLQAAYSGDAGFSPAQAGLSEVIKFSTTNITIAVSANPATFGNITDLTATVQSDGGVATGGVQFKEGASVLGTAALDATGVAILHTTTLSPGPHSILAMYVGDGKASPSTSTAVAFLVKQQTSLALSSNANPALTLDHVVLTATLQNSKAAVATGNVVFSDGGKVVGTAGLNASGTATLDLPPMTAGTHNVTATYAGDDADFPATTSVFPQTVNLRATRTTVSASATSLNDSQQVTLVLIVQSPTQSTVAAPSGSVTMFSGNTAIGTVALDSNGTATFTTRLESNQNASYTATYAGDASYSGSSSNTTTYQAGTAAQFKLSVSSDAVQVARAQHTVITVTAASIKGFSDALKLGCVGLPYAATCTFTKADGSVNTGMDLPANGSGAMQLTIDTGDPLGGGSSTGTKAKAQLLRSTKGVVLCLFPAGLLLLGSARRRRLLPVLMVLLAFALTVGVSGCGGLQVNSTPPGTYTFQVTAVGQGSGVTESQTVTLTVGQ